MNNENASTGHKNRKTTKIDAVTKILLLLIAIGLWINALDLWPRPLAVSASADNVAIEQLLVNINRHVEKISEGTCRNTVICP